MAKNIYDVEVNLEIDKAMQQVSQVKQALEKVTQKGTNNNGVVSQKDMTNYLRMLDEANATVKQLEKNSNKAMSTLGKSGNTQGMREMSRDYNDLAKAIEQVNKASSGSVSKLGVKPSADFKASANFTGKVGNTRTLGDDAMAGFNSQHRARKSALRREMNRSQSLTDKFENNPYVNAVDVNKHRSSQKTLQGFMDSRADNQKEITSKQDQYKKNSDRYTQLSAKPTRSKADKKEQSVIVETNKHLESQIKSLKEWERQLDGVEATINKSTQSLKNIKQVKPDRGTAGYSMYERAPAIAMGMMGVTAGVIGGTISRGGTLKQGMQENVESIGTQTGDFNYNNLRKRTEAMGVNKRLGISGTDLMGMQDSYMNYAGYQGADDLSKATESSGLMKRSTGLSSDLVTSAIATTAEHSGGFDNQSIKNLEQAFLGGLKQSGLVGQGKEQLTALQNMIGTMGDKQDLSDKDVTRISAFQASIAETGSSTMKGEQGANFLNGIDSGIKSGMSNQYVRTALQMSDPERYSNTLQGTGQMAYDLNEGIQNEHVLGAITKYADTLISQGDGSEESQIGSWSTAMENMGMNKIGNDQAKWMMDQSKNGSFEKGLSDKQIKELQSKGKTEAEKNGAGYASSDMATENKFSAGMDKQATAANDATTGLKNLANVTPFLYTGFGVLIKATGALALAFGTAQASMWGAGGIRGLASKGATRSARHGGKGGGMGPFGGGGAGGATLVGGLGSSWKEKAGGLFSRAGDTVKNSKTMTTIANSSVGKGASSLGTYVAGSKAGGAIGKVGKVAGGALGKAGGLLGKAGKAIPGVGGVLMGMSAIQMGGQLSSINSDESLSKQDKASAKGKTIGSTTGAVAGTLAGGALGSLLGPLGTIAGGAIGGWAGEKLGGWAGGKIGNWAGSKGDSATAKADSSTVEKRSATEKERSVNLSKEESVVRSWDKMLDKRSSTTSSDSSSKESASIAKTSSSNNSATTNTATAKTLDMSDYKSTTTNNSSSSKSSSDVKGEIKVTHAGSVSTIADIDKTVEKINNSFGASLPNGNERAKS